MLCDKKHSHVQWRDFKMNVLVCDDDQQIVDSIIEDLKKKSEETHVALRFYGFSQPSQIDLSLPYDIALLDIDMGETNGMFNIWMMVRPLLPIEKMSQPFCLANFQHL